MSKGIAYITLILLLAADLSYSFLQHYAQPLDGDMPSLLVPAPDAVPLHEHPLGIYAIVNNETYLNPNRYFGHVMYREYMCKMPLLIQQFEEPIESVYLAAAIAKTLIQFFVIALLSMAITGSRKFFSRDFLLAAVLITPLFQTNGYVRHMGIIDPATTYTFFYGFSIALLLLYFLPFIFEFYYHKKPLPKKLICFIWIPFALMVSLHGAINPGIALVFSLVLISKYMANNTPKTSLALGKKISYALKNIPSNYWFYLLPLCLFSLYSLYLSTYNSNTLELDVPLIDRYQRLPLGLFKLLTGKPAYLFLFGLLGINAVLIHKFHNKLEGKRILNSFKWLGIFALIYLLLLPLGGFREYRFNIIRYDTFMPITLALFYIYGKSTFFLLQKASKKQKLWYVPIVLLVLTIYTNADKPIFDKNDCEKHALELIANSPDETVRLVNDCSVLSWNLIEDPENSEMNAKLLKKWRITTSEKKYYYKP